MVAMNTSPRFIITLGLILGLGLTLHAQYWNGQDSLYGNEWIEPDLTYFRIDISEDGIYRLDRNSLQSAGVPASIIEARHYQLWRLGEEVPILTSTSGVLSDQDFILFYGQRNRGDFDAHLYPNGAEDQLNPEYSLFTDTAAYFLTWDTDREGRRLTQVASTTSNAPKEDFFMGEEKRVFSNQHLKYCEDLSCFRIYSIFDKGQGWASNNRIQDVTFTFDPTHIFPTGPDPIIEARVTNNVKQASTAGRLAVLVNEEEYFRMNISSNEPPFVGDVAVPFDKDQLGPNMEISFVGLQGQFDAYAVSTLSLKYPRTFNFDNARSYDLEIAASAEEKNIVIENFDAGDLLGVWNHTKGEVAYVPKDTGSTYRFALPPSTEDVQLTLFNPVVIRDINSLVSIDFVDFTSLESDFVIITHPKFREAVNGIDQVAAYADYRSSAKGGGYRPVIVDIHQLYDQFSYGLRFHPSAVRHFVHWFKKNWSTDPFLFIVGKGVENRYIRKSPSEFFFIPTYGAPGADGLLVSDPLLNPLVPIGRLPVIDAEEVATYLEKVKIHESHFDTPHDQENRYWAKRAIHLSGGMLDKPAELALLRRELDLMGNIIEDNMMGMEVNTFQKKTTGTVTVSDNQALTQLVNDGVSLITYFGHSFINLLDFQIIDDVRSFEANTRFPVFMAMGCYAGQLYDANLRSYSENWTLADERGAIACIANSSAGFISSLQIMGTKIYTNYGEDFFTQPIGLSVNQATRSVIQENRLGPNALRFTPDTELAFSLNICGDPAIKLCVGPDPDYIVDARSVRVKESVITVETDSLTLDFEIFNLGKNLEDTMMVRIEQTLPDGEVVFLKEVEMTTPADSSHLSVRIPSFKEKAVGFNKINITVDASNQVAEGPAPIAEGNNDLAHNGSEFCFFVTSDDARPIYPSNFGIVGQQGVTLVSSTSDGNARAINYILQIDTTENFDSPFLRETQIERQGGVIEWTPNISYEEETVYYWRITPDSTGRGSYSWRNASFVYLEGVEDGWNQSHYYQYLYNEFDFVNLNPRNQRWEFEKQFNDLKLKNVVVDDRNFLRPAIIRNVFVDWDYYSYSGRGGNSSTAVRSGVYVTLYDPTRAEPVTNPSPGLYGSVNTSGNDMPFFAFNTQDYDGRVALMNFLENDVPDEHFVVLMTIQEPTRDYGATKWAMDVDSTIGKSIFDVLESEGATMSRILENGDVPYIFVYQKNNQDFQIVEAVGDTENQLEINVPVPGFWREGGVTSVEIGPATEWSEFSWFRDEYTPQTERMVVNITGIDDQGNREVLFDSLDIEQQDLSNISAAEYPRLQLDFFAQDSMDFTIPQLNNWRIKYTGLPDLAVDINSDFSFYADTVQQGEAVELNFAFQNVGPYPMDSVVVRYNIVDEQNRVITASRKVKDTAPGERVVAQFKRNTIDLSGSYRLVVDVNPGLAVPEQNAWNNSLILPFEVIGDDRNPLLDVTFDGMHILDGDLVSAAPEIMIRLTDENTFLLLNDTSLFDLALQYPNSSTYQDVSVGDPDVTFIPADQDENEATIIINKKFTEDGIYTLRVNARDRSGNTSGDVSYQIRFEVVNESSISEVLNYPNPFTTSTQFVYTLTGDAPPAFFKIQIMTVSGKVVREITDAETEQSCRIAGRIEGLLCVAVFEALGEKDSMASSWRALREIYNL
jgi:hypothetical protein